MEQWGDYVRIFLFCANRENGMVSVSPLEILSWPYHFFIVMSFVQGEYQQFVSEINEKAMKKARTQRRPKKRV